MPSSVGISVMSRTTSRSAKAVKSRFNRSGNFGAVWSGGSTAAPLGFAALQALTAHRVRDGVHTDVSPASSRSAWIRGERRCARRPRTARAPGVQGGAATSPLGGPATDPLMERGDADPQDRAGQGVWHPVHGPLVGDKAGHAHFVASLTREPPIVLKHRAPSAAGRSRRATASAPRYHRSKAHVPLHVQHGPWQPSFPGCPGAHPGRGLSGRSAHPSHGRCVPPPPGTPDRTSFANLA